MMVNQLGAQNVRWLERVQKVVVIIVIMIIFSAQHVANVQIIENVLLQRRFQLMQKSCSQQKTLVFDGKQRIVAKKR